MAIPKGNSKCDTCHVAPGWSFMHAELQVQANNNCTMGGMAVPRMTNKKVHNLSVWEWDRANFFFLISFTQKKKGKLFWCICLFSFTAGKEEKKNEKEKESCPDKDSCICCFRPYTTANRQYTWAPQTCFFSWNFPLSLYTWLAPSFLPIFSISRSQLLTTFFLFSSANIFFSFRFCNNS